MKTRGTTGHLALPLPDPTHPIAATYYDDDEGDRAVVYFAEPISSGYVLIQRDRLVNTTTLEDEPWKRTHPEFCLRVRIE